MNVSSKKRHWSKAILVILSVFCAGGNLLAQNTSAIKEMGLGASAVASPSNTLFIQQNELYKQAKSSGDLQGEAKALQQMGQICYQMGLFTQSLSYHIKANEIFRAHKNEKQTADNLNDLALLFLITKQQKEAKQSYFKALSTYQLFKDSTGIAKTYANLGHFYEKVLDYDSAYYYQQKAMQVFDAIGNAEGAALVHENLD